MVVPKCWGASNSSKTAGFTCSFFCLDFLSIDLRLVFYRWVAIFESQPNVHLSFPKVEGIVVSLESQPWCCSGSLSWLLASLSRFQRSLNITFLRKSKWNWSTPNKRKGDSRGVFSNWLPRLAPLRKTRAICKSGLGILFAICGKGKPLFRFKIRWSSN